MKTGERKVIFYSIITSLVIGILAFSFLISFAPDSIPYSVSNYGWNGLHSISTEYSIQEVSSLENTPVSTNSVLLIVSPTSSFSQSDAAFVKQFVQYGGTLVIADSYGFSNTLLSQMNLGIQIETNFVLDPSFNWQSAVYPIALVNSEFAEQFPVFTNVSGIALTEPHVLVITSPLASAVAESSTQSYEVSQYQNIQGNISSFTGPHGPFPLAAIEKIGRGLVLVVGDSSLFTNSVLNGANNKILTLNLLSNRGVYLDTSHWPLNTVTSLRAQFALGYQVFSEVPFRYFLTLVFIGFTALMIQAINGVISLEERMPESRASKFNNDTLDRVRRDRARYGVQHG